MGELLVDRPLGFLTFSSVQTLLLGFVYPELFAAKDRFSFAAFCKLRPGQFSRVAHRNPVGAVNSDPAPP